jgi:AcrR family transcriptional regulator
VENGVSDPARLLALLWRTHERPSRRRNLELDVDRIVQCAIAIADADGLAALSMRRVAQDLGVGTMSLYVHVPGKAELLDIMLDAVVAETVPEAPEAGADGDWRAVLERIARTNYALYLRHPWLLQVATTRPVLGPNVTAKYESDLRAIDGIGLTDIEMDLTVSFLGDYVHGAVRSAIEQAQAAQRGGLTEDQWWAAYAPILAQVIDPQRFPVAGRVGSAAGAEFGSAYAADRAFEFGLARILDGLAALVESRAPRGTVT